MATLHFDMNTGEEIVLQDLFTTDAWDDALRFLSDHVTETVQKDMEEVGYFVDQVDVAAGQDFRLTKEGLVLYWHPYELASYAASFREFLIPWEELAPFLDKEGPAWAAMRLP